MQSTWSASIRFFLIPPSPDWADDMEPLASTKPATPVGARWWTMCCTQAKLALPFGGAPYCQRLSSGQPLAAPVGDVEGRIGEDEVGLEVGVAVVAWKLSPWAICPSMPRMARFIFASRQVV